MYHWTKMFWKFDFAGSSSRVLRWRRKRAGRAREKGRRGRRKKVALFSLSLSLFLSNYLSLPSSLLTFYLFISLIISLSLLSLSLFHVFLSYVLSISFFHAFLSLFYAFLSLLQPLYLVRSFFITLPLTLSFHILDSDFLFSLCYVSLLLFVSVTWRDHWRRLRLFHSHSFSWYK